MVKAPAGITLVRRNPEAKEPMKAAVLAALVVGQPAIEIAHRFGLPPATVRKWKEDFDLSDPVKRRDTFSEMMLVFVEQEIANLISISIATSDEDWIKEQKASEIAQLVAVKQDRLMEIFRAFGKVQEQRQRFAGEIEDGSSPDTSS